MGTLALLTGPTGLATLWAKHRGPSSGIQITPPPPQQMISPEVIQASRLHAVQLGPGSPQLTRGLPVNLNDSQVAPGQLAPLDGQACTVLSHLVLFDFSITQGGVPSHNVKQDPGSIVIRGHTRTGLGDDTCYVTI